MNKFWERDIVETLKQELEYRDGDYSQWIVGISIRKLGTSRAAKEGVYTARLVVQTNESPYVDGMDILFKSSEEGIAIDPLYYENTPEYQGGELGDAVRWLERNGEIVYRQKSNPYQLDIYIERLQDILKEYFFKDLSEYGLDGDKKDLLALYQDLIQETLLEKVVIAGKETGPGEFQIKVLIGNNPYILKVKSIYSREDVADGIVEKVIRPLLVEE